MKNVLKYIYDILPFKKYIFQCIRFFNIPKSIYQHLSFKGIFKVHLNNHYFLIEHYGYQIENEIFWAGLTNGFEKKSLQLWIELCKDSNTILDIGANTGLYSLIAKTVKPGADIYGFEPVKRVYQKFKKNCDINNFDITCLNYALSNYDGDAVIYDTPAAHVYSVSVNKNLSCDGTKTIETKIKTQKLSTFIKKTNLKTIDLIKIDVETHEPEVLEGMDEFLKIFQPTLLIEILSDEIGSKVQHLINDIDYLYFNIDEENTYKRVSTISKSYTYNYLLCKREIAGKLNLI